MRHITLYCPTCDEPFYCNVDPPDRSVGIMGATIAEVWAASDDLRDPVCPHVQTWFDYSAYSERRNPELEKFADRLYDQLDQEIN